MIREKWQAVVGWHARNARLATGGVMALWTLLVLSCGLAYFSEEHKRSWAEFSAIPWYVGLLDVVRNPASAGDVERNAPRGFAFAPNGTLLFTPDIAPDVYPELDQLRVTVAPWIIQLSIKGKSTSLQPERLYWLWMTAKAVPDGEVVIVKSTQQLMELVEASRIEERMALMLGRIEPDSFDNPILKSYAMARFPAGEATVDNQMNAFGFFNFAKPAAPILFASEIPIVLEF